MSIFLTPRPRVKWFKFRPFLGEVKKGPLMSIFLFKCRNVEVQLLRQHWMHSFYLLDATNAAT